MSTLFYVLLILAPAAILATAYAIIKKRNQGRSIKRSVAVNLATFAVLTVLIAALSVSVFAADDNNASAADASAATTATETVDNSKGMGLLAAGLVTGLAGIGGGIAVGNAAPAAIGATSEDPKAFGKAIIFVVLGEGIAIYGMLVSILLIFAR